MKKSKAPWTDVDGAFCSLWRRGSGHGFGLLDGTPVHAAGEPLLVEGRGEGDGDRAFAVVLPSLHQNHQTKCRFLDLTQGDDAAFHHPEQIGDVADRLLPEGQAQLARSGEGFLEGFFHEPVLPGLVAETFGQRARISKK